MGARECKLGSEGSVLNSFENRFNIFLPAELSFCEGGKKKLRTWEIYFRLEKPVLDLEHSFASGIEKLMSGCSDPDFCCSLKRVLLSCIAQIVGN